MRVRITGEMWWWRVAYLDRQGRTVMLDANELHILVGEPVTMELETAVFIHSFWKPRHSGTLDMIHGRSYAMRIQEDKTGVSAEQGGEYRVCATAGRGVGEHASQRAAFWDPRANK